MTRLLKDKAASNDLPMSPIYRGWEGGRERGDGCRVYLRVQF